MESNPYEPPKSQLEEIGVKNTGMFSHLTNYSYQRTIKQAIGFYITYFILGLLIGSFVGGIAGVMSKGDPQQAGFVSGSIAAIVICISLAITVAIKKKIIKSIKTMENRGQRAIVSNLSSFEYYREFYSDFM